MPAGSSWSIEHFLRTMRSRLLPTPQPPMSDEQRQEREDAQARLEDELEDMKERHRDEDREE
jgi:hypothetical protein